MEPPAFGLPWQPRGLMWEAKRYGTDSPRKDKLLIFTAALLGRAPQGPGLKLNYPRRWP